MTNFFLITLSVLAINASVYAQKERKYFLGSHFSFGKSEYYPYGNSGGSNYKGRSYHTIGIDFGYKVSADAVEFYTGLFATNVALSYNSVLHGWSESGNGTRTTVNDGNFRIFSVPVHFKYHFLKYLFADFGVSANLNITGEDKLLFGAEAGIGAEYVSSSGMSLSIAHQMQFNINVMQEPRYSSGIDKLIRSGIKIGLGYRF
ncbi:MAG: hypothetical protein LBH32_13900 [Dysgonamonadaceae bacterium]|jgi:hypothetical protein|nr:hypothetical protein [Dysgonamonadaceae bacterium]